MRTGLLSTQIGRGERRQVDRPGPATTREMTRPEDILAGIDLFRQVAPAQRVQIARQVHLRRYTAGQLVVAHHDPDRDVYFVIEGRVRVTLFSEAGREIAFRDLEAGETFGELAAIDRQPRSANVVALADTLLGSLDPDLFLGAALHHPPLGEALLRKLTGLVRSLSERVYEFGLPVPVRIGRELVRLARRGMISEMAARIRPVPKHAEIASRINTHREAVSRTLAQLQRMDIVRRGQGELLVPDIRRLEAWTEKLELDRAHQG